MALGNVEWYKASAKRMLKDRCDVRRMGKTLNEYGDEVEALVTIYENEPTLCSALASTRPLVTLDSQDITDLRWQFGFTTDRDIRRNDRIVCNGEEFNVEGDDEAASNLIIQQIVAHRVVENPR